MPTYYGVVKGNTVVLPENIQLPEGVAVEVRIPTSSVERADESEAEVAFMQRLVELGLLTEIRTPDRTQDDQGRTLIQVEGKPLSEMIIEERR